MAIIASSKLAINVSDIVSGPCHWMCHLLFIYSLENRGRFISSGSHQGTSSLYPDSVELVSVWFFEVGPNPGSRRYGCGVSSGSGSGSNSEQVMTVTRLFQRKVRMRCDIPSDLVLRHEQTAVPFVPCLSRCREESISMKQRGQNQNTPMDQL